MLSININEMGLIRVDIFSKYRHCPITPATYIPSKIQIEHGKYMGFPICLNLTATYIVQEMEPPGPDQLKAV